MPTDWKQTIIDESPELPYGDEKDTLHTSPIEFSSNDTIERRGRGMWPGRGTQLFPHAERQLFLLRHGFIGPGRFNPGSCFRDFSIWDNEFAEVRKTGLELSGWSTTTIEKLGVCRLGIGIDFRPTKRAVDLDARRLHVKDCDVGIRWDCSGTGTVCRNDLSASVLGGGIALDVVAPGRTFTVPKFYCEAQKVAGIIHRSGEAKYCNVYAEQDRQDLDGDFQKDDLVPSFAALGGSPTLIDPDKISWLYQAPGVSVQCPPYALDKAVGYFVFVRSDPRIDDYRDDYPIRAGANARVLIIEEEWAPGKALQVSRN